MDGRQNQERQYETIQSAGVDLRADIADEIKLNPLERILVGTGLYISLPKGFEAQIRPRSGMAYKHGLTVLNSPGTIDADYRGEIKVLMVKLLIVLPILVFLSNSILSSNFLVISKSG